jgi:hypothetical protein
MSGLLAQSGCVEKVGQTNDLIVSSLRSFVNDPSQVLKRFFRTFGFTVAFGSDTVLRAETPRHR